MQVVPHVTNAIQDWIERVAVAPVDGKDGIPDVCVIELGGTVGDIESMPFIEALRQFQFKVSNLENCDESLWIDLSVSSLQHPSSQWLKPFVTVPRGR